jgi:hypothetical protein
MPDGKRLAHVDVFRHIEHSHAAFADLGCYPDISYDFSDHHVLLLNGYTLGASAKI